VITVTYSKDTEKIGRISVEVFRDSVRLRFRVDGQRYSLTIGKNNKETWEAAIAKAKQIEVDILWNNGSSVLVMLKIEKSLTERFFNHLLIV
jgi:hypothetical protein